MKKIILSLLVGLFTLIGNAENIAEALSRGCKPVLLEPGKTLNDLLHTTATPESIGAVALTGDVTRVGTLGGSNAILQTDYPTLRQVQEIAASKSTFYLTTNITTLVTNFVSDNTQVRLLSLTNGPTTVSCSVVYPSLNSYPIGWVFTNQVFSGTYQGGLSHLTIWCRENTPGSTSSHKPEFYFISTSGSNKYEYVENAVAKVVPAGSTYVEQDWDIVANPTNLPEPCYGAIRMKVTAISGTPTVDFQMGDGTVSHLQIDVPMSMQLQPVYDLIATKADITYVNSIANSTTNYVDLVANGLTNAITTATNGLWIAVTNLNTSSSIGTTNYVSGVAVGLTNRIVDATNNVWEAVTNLNTSTAINTTNYVNTVAITNNGITLVAGTNILLNGASASVKLTNGMTVTIIATNSVIPGPGITDLGNTANIVLSGVTVAYVANPSVTHTITVSRAVAYGYCMTLTTFSTNSYVLGTGLQLYGSHTIGATNEYVFGPMTQNVYKVRAQRIQ